MGFLRRFLGGDGDEAGAAVRPEPAVDAATINDDERAREIELARFDRDRVDDLVRRQQRYADRSWRPPSQGGDRRADDGDSAPT